MLYASSPLRPLFSAGEPPENRISFYLLACFLVALPFAHFFSEIILTCFTVHTLIHTRKNHWPLLRNKSFWILSGVFFLNLVTLSYSPYRGEGLKNISHQFGLILFPACLTLTTLDLKKYRLSLLKIFAYTCVGTVGYLYIQAFRVLHYFHYSVFQLWDRAFINQNFSQPIGLHATYLSMYVALSICILIFCFLAEQKKRYGHYAFCIVLLSAAIVQLSSRSVGISLCLIGLAVVPAWLLKGKRRKGFLLIAVASFLTIGLVIANNSALEKRYFHDLEDDLSENALTSDFSETRMKRWDLVIDLVSASPLTGYGNGAEKFILKDRYFEKKFYRSFLLELNAHNQFLSFWLNDGLAGLLLYLFTLFYGFSLAVKRRDFLFLAFMILITTVSLSENILDVNKGIFFYSFFYALFVFNTPTSRNNPV